jgi:hypothetical protein
VTWLKRKLYKTLPSELFHYYSLRNITTRTHTHANSPSGQTKPWGQETADVIKTKLIFSHVTFFFVPVIQTRHQPRTVDQYTKTIFPLTQWKPACPHYFYQKCQAYIIIRSVGLSCVSVLLNNVLKTHNFLLLEKLIVLQLVNKFPVFYGAIYFTEPGSSVSTVLGWTTGWSRFDLRQRIFPLASVSRPALGPTQPPVQWVPGVLSPGLNRGRGVTLTTHPI